MMSEMVKRLNSDIEIHPVLISGIAQFQLVHIHPFLDGNGRTSRLLSTFCLYKPGTISSVRENDMDMPGWLDYFITGLEAQMIEVKNEANRLFDGMY